ncbi:MAG: hypothetical protein JNG86_22985 [Verrucomicrobiaceae bacterium]|nr:hypothetical protein [Verrucomicrobiaceae bacterium]
MTLVSKTLRVLAVASSVTLLAGYVVYSQKAAAGPTVPQGQFMLSSSKSSAVVVPPSVLSVFVEPTFLPLPSNSPGLGESSWKPALNAAPVFDSPANPRRVNLMQSPKPMMSSSKSGIVTLEISPASLLEDFDSWLGRSQNPFNQPPEIVEAQARSTSFLDAVRTFGAHSDDTTNPAVRQQVWGDHTPRIKETPPYASYRLDTLPAHMYGMTVNQMMMSSSKGAMVTPSVVLTQIEELAAFMTRRLFPAEEWTAPPPPFDLSAHQSSLRSYSLDGKSALATSLEQVEESASLGAAMRWLSPLSYPGEINASLLLDLPASNKVSVPKP